MYLNVLSVVGFYALMDARRVEGLSLGEGRKGAEAGGVADSQWVEI